MICKGHECSLEAGFQVLLQVYIQMQTQWLGVQVWRDLKKPFMQDGGKQSLHLSFQMAHLKWAIDLKWHGNSQGNLLSKYFKALHKV